MSKKTYHPLIERPLPRLLSLVIPCYNEQEMVPILREELSRFLPQLPCPVEVIVVNDGSSDKTLDLLFAWAAVDNRIKVLGFARNFGHQAAVTAGMDAARGDAIVIMDADLQDPPEVLFEMLKKYCLGFDIVYGQREERPGESWFKRLTAWGFYRVMQTLVHRDLPLDTGDFRLISRECLDVLNSMRETHRFLRGMGAWVGFAQTPVVYKRSQRVAGETKYPLSKMLKFAWTAAISFSPLPLRISLGFGIVVALLGFCMAIYALTIATLYYLKLIPELTYSPGWATIMILISLVGGAILTGIGILGEYVGSIYESIKSRPLYIVKYRRNIPAE